MLFINLYRLKISIYRDTILDMKNTILPQCIHTMNTADKHEIYTGSTEYDIIILNKYLVQN